MIMSNDGLETKVWIIPYKESSISKDSFVETHESSVIISSVKNHEDELVKITLPDGHTTVAKAWQLITAIKKCVL